MSTTRLLARLLVSYAFAKIVGASIRWHVWRAHRCDDARVRHAAGLLALASISAREERRIEQLVNEATR